jgi:2-dehydropantoate 2-reductase
MRIAIFGSGGVGGYFGGRLAEAGEDVFFLARGEHLRAMRRGGLAVESTAGDFQIPRPRATDDPAEVGPVDAVLLCVKAWQVPEAARAIGPLLGPETFVVPLQNGIEAAEQITDEIGPGRVVPGLCKILSYLSGPGKVRHAGVDPWIAFGEEDGSPSPRVAELRRAFEGSRGVRVEVPSDIRVALWEKFLFIAPFSAVGAVTRMPAGVVRSIPETRRMLESAMREVVSLARASGVDLRDDSVARTMAFVDGLPAAATSSMQRDIIEGRPSELSSQSGAITRLSKAAGLPAPVNEFLYASLLPSERRARGELSA